MSTKKVHSHLNITSGCSLTATSSQHTIGALTISSETLVFPNELNNRRIVLWDDASPPNNHQYYGLGINGSTLRFNVGSPGAAFRFFRGDSAGGSTEVFNINGYGSISGIGSATFSGGATFMSGKTSVFGIEDQGTFCRLAVNELRIWEHDHGNDIAWFNDGYLRVAGNMPWSPSGNGVHIGLAGGHWGAIELKGVDNNCYIDFGSSGNDFGARILYDNYTLRFYASGTERMTMNGDGIVKINSYAANIWTDATFSVYGGANMGQWYASYFGSGGGVTGQNAYAGDGTVSIYGSRHIFTAWNFVVSSDSRIKKDIQDINDGEALSKLRQLQPKTYKYIDPMKGTERVYGFIAQEVKEVLPQAVTLEHSTIPNVMGFATATEHTLTLTSTEKTFDFDLTNGNQLEIFKHNNSGDRIEATIVSISEDKKTVTIEETLDTPEYYIQGQIVNDFNALNKDAVWTVGTAALQEVDRGVQDVKVKIQNVKSSNQELKAFLRSKYPGEI